MAVTFLRGKLLHTWQVQPVLIVKKYEYNLTKFMTFYAELAGITVCMVVVDLPRKTEWREINAYVQESIIPLECATGMGLWDGVIRDVRQVRTLQIWGIMDS